MRTKRSCLVSIGRYRLGLLRRSTLRIVRVVTDRSPAKAPRGDHEQADTDAHRRGAEEIPGRAEVAAGVLIDQYDTEDEHEGRDYGAKDDGPRRRLTLGHCGSVGDAFDERSCGLGARRQTLAVSGMSVRIDRCAEILGV